MDLTDYTIAARLVADMSTPASDLTAIAQHHPGLRTLVAGHPNTDPAIFDWLNSMGDPEVSMIISRRRIASAPPAPAPGFGGSTPPPPSAGYQSPWQPTPPQYAPTPPQASPPKKSRTTLIVVIVVVVVTLIAAAIAAVSLLDLTHRNEPTSTNEPTWRTDHPWERTLCGSDADRFHNAAVTGFGDIIVFGSALSTDRDYADVIKTPENQATIAIFSPTGELISLTASEGVSYQASASAPDGDVVVVGQTTGDFEDVGPYVAKLNSDGEMVWSVSGIPWSSEHLSGAWDLAIDGSGNITVLGTIGEFQDFIAQLDANGSLKWFTAIDDNDRVGSITRTHDDGIVVVGRGGKAGDPYGETSDYVVMKYSSQGKLIWRTAGGDHGNNRFYSVTTLNDMIVAVGAANRFEGDFPEADKFDAIMVAYDGSGKQLWERSYSGNGANRFFGITVGANSDFYVRGVSKSSDGELATSYSNDPSPYGGEFIARFEKDGELFEVNFYGGGSEITLTNITSTGTAVVTVGYTSMTGGSLPPTCGESDALIIYRPVI